MRKLACYSLSPESYSGLYLLVLLFCKCECINSSTFYRFLYLIGDGLNTMLWGRAPHASTTTEKQK